jgi:hypothetical protein
MNVRVFFGVAALCGPAAHWLPENCQHSACLLEVIFSAYGFLPYMSIAEFCLAASKQLSC